MLTDIKGSIVLPLSLETLLKFLQIFLYKKSVSNNKKMSRNAFKEISQQS